MKNKYTWTAVTILAAAWIGTGAPAVAQNPGAHVHGEADMDVIFEGKTISIAFRAPGADIVGFEHDAESSADKKAVADALARLEAAADVFVLPSGAKCRVREAHAESSLLEDGDDGHKHDHKDEHDHKNDHGRKDEHGHTKEHGQKNEHEQGHGGFSAHYVYTCAAPDGLGAIDTRLFTLFPSLREVHARIIGPAGQSAATLTPSETSVSLGK